MEGKIILDLICFLVVAVVILSVLVLTFLKRRDPVIKANVPYLTIFIGITSLFVSLYVTQNIVRGHTPIIFSLWIPFSLMALVGLGYLFKSWKIYTYSLAAKAKLLHINQGTLSSSNSLSSRSLSFNSSTSKSSGSIDEEKGSRNSDDDVSDANCCTLGIDTFVYLHPHWSRGPFIAKAFILMWLVFLIVPLAMNIGISKYHKDPMRESDYKPISEIAIVVLIFLIGDLFLLVKLWKVDDSYGLKVQLKGVFFSWLVIEAISVFGFAVDSKGFVIFFDIFSITLFLVPFFFDAIYPLWRSRQVKKALTEANQTEMKNFNLEYIVSYKSRDRSEPGMSSLVNFLLEEYTEVDMATRDKLFHCLLLLRDIWRKREEHLEEEDACTDDKQLKKMRREHDCVFQGSALLLWQRYILDEAVDWYPTSKKALYPVLISEELKQQVTEAIKKSLEGKENEHLPGEVFRELTKEIIEETTADMFNKYLVSPPFSEFLKTLIKKEQMNTAILTFQDVKNAQLP